MTLLKQYFSYALVGAFVGATTVLLREVSSKLLPDTEFWYVFTILTIYSGAIFLSFFLQKRLTFKLRKEREKKKQLIQFIVFSVFTAVLTSALSYGFRYGFRLDNLIGDWAGGTAFVLAALITSAVGFLINSKLVFKA